ncbi:acyltransferase [Gordonia sp. HY002]|uniref:acyltransferase family protein n=1 Tax=Gordonia zhenghanii TaxID=2911516 RepID=UPI001EF15B25|nr:acyltransferase family protein [Gordonia zhenghanii]MCF8570966.1 acyltransferase [Gordonia zhenghanii]MCF8604709.1 acyltransferase [Gordonia zhenghanii]
MTKAGAINGPQSHSTPNEDAAAGTNSGYRLDLDGLRGIAIFLVAIFHVWFGRVSGGVDVFLTLSGYFFVASLLKHVIRTNPADQSWSVAINPWPRLSRMLRRLIPALFLLLAVIAALTWWLMPSTRWAPLGKEIVASAFYYQNYHLALASQDYGAADSAVSPLQHLWSMAMQGQFFFITIISALALGGLLKLGARFWPALGRPRVITGVVGGSLAVVALVSFAWANYRHGINQPFNYYDTIARVWEPITGGVLAIWMPRIRLPDWLRTALTAVAVLLIATSGIWIAGVEQYPALLALVPAGSTLLLIWLGSSASARREVPGNDLSAGGRVLAHPWIVWLGSIAYALYLWHWPFLIFYMSWRFKDDVSFLEGTMILVVSVIVAWLTTKFVEAPLRAGRGTGFTPRYRRILAVGLVVATLFSLGSAGYWQYRADHRYVDTTNLDTRDYPGARAFLSDFPTPAIEAVPSPEAAERDWPLNHRPHFSNFGDPSIRVGVYGDPTATRTMAVVGGSHSEHWMTALDVIGKKRGFRVTTYMKAGCAMSTEAAVEYNGELLTECNDWAERVADKLDDDKPDVIFTTASRPVDDGKGDVVPKGYLDYFALFRDRGQKVIAVRDTPWTHGPMIPRDCIAAGKNPEVCGVSRERALSEVSPIDAIAGDFPNMTFLDYSDAFCRDGYCPAVVGNILVWHDSHHLTTAFIRSLIPYLDADIGKATEWWPPQPPMFK